MLHTRTQHKNARLTPRVRLEMVNKVDNGTLTKSGAGRIYGIHRNTVAKWVKEVKENGNWMCLDSKSTPEKYRVSSGLRKLTEVEARINRRINRDRMRYVREHPGELVHIDTKKMPALEGETASDGKEYLYVAVDDATRYLYAAVMGDKTDDSAHDFLEEVLTTSPFPIDSVMTDNGREYKGKLERGHAFETLLDSEHIKHIYTKPHTPRTNGKAERVIRTIIAWHHMIKFNNRQERSYMLTDFVTWYNSKKGHSSLKGETPVEYLVNHYKHCEKCTQRLGK